MVPLLDPGCFPVFSWILGLLVRCTASKNFITSWPRPQLLPRNVFRNRTLISLHSSLILSGVRLSPEITMSDYEDDTTYSMILVMGLTGSGKSYFINQLVAGSVKEGDSLNSGECNSLSAAALLKRTKSWGNRDGEMPDRMARDWSRKGCNRRHARLRRLQQI
jgi:hypothetical protein